MQQISKRVQALAPSQTLAMSQKSQELKAQGVDVINLSVGEPDFFTPDFIKEAAKKAIDDNFSFYTPVPGYLSLRKAISEKLKRENGLDFAPEQIVVSNGAKQSLCNVILTVVNPGDEVVIPTPAWVSYVEMVNLAEGKSVLVPATIEQNFKITPAQLREALTERTKIVLFCSPSNPTGSVYSREELQALVEVLSDYPDVLVLSDEIYEHINFTGSFTSLASFPAIADRTCIVNGVSKAYAMTGWRIGYLAAPLWLAKATNKLQSQYTSGASSIAQKAAEAAYTGPQDCVEDMRKAFERRRDLVVGLAKAIPGLGVNTPEGAFYLFPEVSSYFGKRCGDRVIENDADLAMYLLEEGHVATVAGSAFCCPGYIRLSYATSDDNICEAMRRIAEALAKLI
ncbi:MAG TPA: pyridoxal phosphate-dependent aminotransferase [Muribaculum sp.]|uniref:Aminotransferase n=1 Tax=Heminiphilus faecis TaxID=2601703 RepID=A0ABV4CTY9_9BACT|nr:pyridoxal phosphate-dependent aminotransferase [Heminiphilus faecis]RLT75430.1 pyridoxal phosphate-dependent aminotransferase [bacterium J10(2018)]HRF68800.1 pyridoxal phosphate-dependent aminotransferase [Muribaculum sp.]